MYWYLVLVLAIFQYGDAFPTEPKLLGEPSFCRGLECPEYKVMMKTADFEERCYAEYKWASTDVSGIVVFKSEPLPNFCLKFCAFASFSSWTCESLGISKYIALYIFYYLTAEADRTSMFRKNVLSWEIVS